MNKWIGTTSKSMSCTLNGKARKISHTLKGVVVVMILLWFFGGIAQADTLSVDTTTYICVNYGDSLVCIGAADKDSTIFRADIMLSFSNIPIGGVKQDIAFFYVDSVGDTVKMAKVGILQYSPADTTKVKQ